LAAASRRNGDDLAGLERGQQGENRGTAFISGRCEQTVPRGLDEANDLLALYGGKAGQKIVNGLAAFEVVHQVLHRHPGPGENGSAPHDFRVGVEDFSQMLFAHGENLTSPRRKGKDAEIEKLKAKADKVDSLEKQLNELKQMVQSLAAKK
jgi:hypothetical protein